MNLTDAKLVFLDVETTGLAPAMGDRIVEIGAIACRGESAETETSWLLNPARSIPESARRIHGIGDGEVAGCPTFQTLATKVADLLDGAWIIGHNVRFDIGFLAMEFAAAGCAVNPGGCLDTCQLARGVWKLPNYRLETIVRSLRLPIGRLHRALDDARLTRAVFDGIVSAAGGWPAVTIKALQARHAHLPRWPQDAHQRLPAPLHDALAGRTKIAIRYVSGDGFATQRTIQPVACFPAGRFTYMRAHCDRAGELRTFRLDRIIFSRETTLDT